MMLLAALAMVSCSDFLELKHESNISADDFNRTEDELYTSLVGCYNGMQGALYREWAMTELRSDNTRIYARTSSTSIFDVIRQLDLSTIQPINYLVDEYWAGNYHNIERCNTVLRDYAVVGDVLLLYAEIVNELEGPTPEAVNCVNMIRERAGLQPLSSEKTANSYLFRTAIRNERRLELAFENQRWFDLLRWGIAVDLIGEHYRQEFIYSNLPNDYQPTIVEWQTLLPIPLNVMNINPELTQNYGY